MAHVFKDDNDTRLNPGESISDQKFNEVAGRSETDDLENSYNADSADLSQENENIKKLRDQENNAGNVTNQSDNLDDLESKPGTPNKGSSGFANNFTGGSGGKKWFKLDSKTTKKYGPITGIIIAVVGGGIGITALLSPTFVIFQVLHTLTGIDKSTPALTLRTKMMLKVKADGIKNGFATLDADGKCGIKCRFGTVSDSMIAKMQKNGFTVDADKTKIPGRNILNSVQFPDTIENGKSIPGDTVTNGNDFVAALKDPAKASFFNKVFDPTTAFQMNSKFKGILSLLGLNKGPQTKGATEAEVANSEREKLGLPEEGETIPAEPGSDADLDNKVGTKASSAFKEKISGVSGRLGKVTNIVGATCAVYSASKFIVLADKVAKIAAFTTLAWTFLNGAEQIMAGDGTPALSSFLGDQATQPDSAKKNADGTKNEFYGQSLTDSNGYKMAAYNENPGKLSGQEAKYSITALGVIGMLSSFASFLGGKAGSDQSRTLNAACSPGAQWATTATICAAETAAGSEVPVLGNLAGFGLCILENGAAALGTSFAIEKILPPITEQVIKADAPQIAGIVGGALGDAMYSGTSSVFTKTDMGYGMAAATSPSEVAQYAIDTASIKQENDQVAIYEAKKSPLDIYNQYSFMGMLAQNLHLASFATSSFATNLQNVASIIPLGFKSLFSSSFAASSVNNAAQEASLYTNSGCTDPGLSDIGVVADSLCDTTSVMDSATMNMDIGTTIDYMTSNGFADIETGLALSGTDYAKYVTYCTNRAEPFGEGGSLGDDDYMWEVGANCQPKTADDGVKDELPYFQAYTMDFSANGTMESDDVTNKSSVMSVQQAPTGGTNLSSGALYQSSVGIACAPGTTDAGTDAGYRNGQKIEIRLCSIPNTTDESHGNGPAKVNSVVSGAFLAMIQALSKSLGVSSLRVADSYRSMADQEEAVAEYGLGRAAKAGYSNHQMGLAIDFQLDDNDGSARPGDPTWEWLTAHAATYGMAQLPSEAWHWQPKGAD